VAAGVLEQEHVHDAVAAVAGLGEGEGVVVAGALVRRAIVEHLPSVGVRPGAIDRCVGRPVFAAAAAVVPGIAAGKDGVGGGAAAAAAAAVAAAQGML